MRFTASLSSAANGGCPLHKEDYVFGSHRGGMVADGMTTEEILLNFNDLEKEDVRDPSSTQQRRCASANFRWLWDHEIPHRCP